MDKILKCARVKLFEGEKVLYVGRHCFCAMSTLFVLAVLAIVAAIVFNPVWVIVLAALLSLLAIGSVFATFNTVLIVTNKRVTGRTFGLNIDLPLNKIVALASCSSSIKFVGKGFTVGFCFLAKTDECRDLINSIIFGEVNPDELEAKSYKCEFLEKSKCPCKKSNNADKADKSVKSATPKKSKKSRKDFNREELPALLTKKVSDTSSDIPSETAFSTTFEMVSRSLSIMSKQAAKEMKETLYKQLKIADGFIDCKADKNSDEYAKAKDEAYFRYLEDKKVVHGCHTYVECEEMLKRLNEAKH